MNTPLSTNCEQIIGRIESAVESRCPVVSLIDDPAFSGHLARCGRCEQRYARECLVDGVTAQVLPPTPSVDLADRIFERIPGDTVDLPASVSVSQPWFRRGWLRVATGVCLCLLVAWGVRDFLRGDPPESNRVATNSRSDASPRDPGGAITPVTTPDDSRNPEASPSETDPISDLTRDLLAQEGLPRTFGRRIGRSVTEFPQLVLVPGLPSRDLIAEPAPVDPPEGTDSPAFVPQWHASLPPVPSRVGSAMQFLKTALPGRSASRPVDPSMESL